jgi:hypothetical protein
MVAGVTQRMNTGNVRSVRNETRIVPANRPLASANAAAKLCKTLERFRLTCQPTIFSGRHLALD